MISILVWINAFVTLIFAKQELLSNLIRDDLFDTHPEVKFAAPSPKNSKRRPVVYTFDWSKKCFELGFCAEPTAASAIEVAYSISSNCHIMSRNLTVSVPSSFGLEFGENDYSTDWNFLPELFRQRLQPSSRHSRLSGWTTTDPNAATLFFIPFYLLTPFVNKARFVCAPNTCTTIRCTYRLAKEYSSHVAHWFELNVLNSTYFHRNSGRDFFVNAQGVNSQELRLVFERELKYVTKITVERVIWNHNGVFKSFKTLGYDSIGRGPMDPFSGGGGKWAAVGYPGFHHPTKEAYHPCRDTRNLNKTNLLAMAFSNDTYFAKTNYMRQRLLLDCAQRPNPHCESYKFQRHGNFHWKTGEFHGISRQEIVSLYRKSKFCMVPEGDMLASSRFWDTLSACCIPVMSNPRTADEWPYVYSFKAVRELIFATTRLSLPDGLLPAAVDRFPAREWENQTFANAVDIVMGWEKQAANSFAVWRERFLRLDLNRLIFRFNESATFDVVDATIDTLLQALV